ncbi:MAG: 50S ribosomal protein L11 methyltransferase [Candidatus Marinimicrobia bacterium]|nr:50S ribosomal protein L11 methyltransferase [Candidatus Neomarinimicrobiota bacterium]MBT4713246.1 50S ribosomal protein L11 methyltransferase [Candidatus Neomarinimicrobiota bacterium]MBT4946292.1 50S ribosomal protein L11 methyltransferase [Candidatus Neomarinimicrobiota bacterium]MBT5271063.1 50S ribosomal protein L11 methyltransferase [Candidatus Neomarinimicrobiota bacterium]MBT6009977.1 50S ribosomal protein L11 methyltransferase [Candidatus Neomarinimicrobiota bacterium]
MIDTTSQWVSADICIADQYREIAIDFAMALGGLAVVEKDDVFQVSYPLDNETQLVLEKLKTFIIDLDQAASMSQDVVDRENWNKNWQAFFKPTSITEQLIILPEWEVPDQFPQAIKTRIRPAMAFGTGTHETTQLCLEILDDLVQGGERVLDVGTGSGILGITALLKGAAEVDGLENDPFTEENIRDNLELNGIQSGFNLQISEAPVLNPPYDIMVANIIRARLFPILPGFFASVRRGGKVIVSGPLQVEDPETRELLALSPWEVLRTYTKNEWIAYLCVVK